MHSMPLAGVATVARVVGAVGLGRYPRPLTVDNSFSHTMAARRSEGSAGTKTEIAGKQRTFKFK